MHLARHFFSLSIRSFSMWLPNTHFFTQMSEKFSSMLISSSLYLGITAFSCFFLENIVGYFNQNYYLIFIAVHIIHSSSSSCRTKNTNSISRSRTTQPASSRSSPPRAAMSRRTLRIQARTSARKWWPGSETSRAGSLTQEYP